MSNYLKVCISHCRQIHHPIQRPELKRVSLHMYKQDRVKLGLGSKSQRTRGLFREVTSEESTRGSQCFCYRLLIPLCYLATQSRANLVLRQTRRLVFPLNILRKEVQDMVPHSHNTLVSQFSIRSLAKRVISPIESFLTVTNNQLIYIFPEHAVGKIT